VVAAENAFAADFHSLRRCAMSWARSSSPPDAERQFAQRMGADTIEVTSGHCAMVSHPEETHERIVTAANAAG
jgi:hypothetical protein